MFRIGILFLIFITLSVKCLAGKKDTHDSYIRKSTISNALIGKKQRISDLLRSISTEQKISIIVDGILDDRYLDVSNVNNEDMIFFVARSCDYVPINVKDGVILLKDFSKDNVFPDLTVAELQVSIMDIKRSMESLFKPISGKQIVTNVFKQAMAFMTPYEIQLINSNKGILIGSLNDLARNKVIEGIYNKRCESIYNEWNNASVLLSNLDSSKLLIPDNDFIVKKKSIKIEFSKGTINESYINLSHVQDDLIESIHRENETKTNISDYHEDIQKVMGSSVDIPNGIKQHYVTIFNSSKLNIGILKKYCELNHWVLRTLENGTYRTSRLNTPMTDGSIQILKSIPDLLPRNVTKFLTDIVKDNEKRSTYIKFADMPEYLNLKMNIDGKIDKMYNFCVGRIIKMVKNSKKEYIDYNEMDYFDKKAIRDYIFCYCIRQSSDDLMKITYDDLDYLINPKNAKIMHEFDSVSETFTVIGEKGGGFSLRMREIRQ